MSEIKKKVSRLISFEELRPLKGISFSKMTIWRMTKEGKFPKPVLSGKQQKQWFDHELDEWAANLPREGGHRPPPPPPGGHRRRKR